MKKSDIVWYNSQTGETQIWFMDENRIARRATVVDESGSFIPIGPPFSIAGIGEFAPGGSSHAESAAVGNAHSTGKDGTAVRSPPRTLRPAHLEAVAQRLHAQR